MSDILALAEDVRRLTAELAEAEERAGWIDELRAQLHDAEKALVAAASGKKPKESLANARRWDRLYAADTIESLTPDETRADIEAEDAKMDGLDTPQKGNVALVGAKKFVFSETDGELTVAVDRLTKLSQDSETEATDTSEQSYTSHGE